MNGLSETELFREGAPSCQVYVDEEGEWYHKGSRIFRRDILQLFYEHMVPDDKEGYLIRWQGRECRVDAADTPFVVTRVDAEGMRGSSPESIRLTFKHLEETERLDPDSLWVGEGNVPYCRIRGGLFRARFSRPAYYQLAQWIGEGPDTGQFYLETGGHRFPVRT